MSWLIEEGLKDSRSPRGADILDECSSIMGFSLDSRTRQRFMVLPQRNYQAQFSNHLFAKAQLYLKLAQLWCVKYHVGHIGKW